jgi:hypothetical protein
MASQATESFVERREGEFWINAAIGALVAVAFSFVPVSPIVGGGVAGYLQQGTRTEGAKVGAASGLIAALPVFAVFTLLFGGLGLGVLLEGSALGLALFWGIMLFGIVVTVLVAGGMGAVGGYLGVVLGERYDGDDRDEYERRPADPAVETPR